MTLLTVPSEAARKIIRALDLPKNTVACTLRMRVGQVVTVDIETYAEDQVAGELATTLKSYRLVELNGQNIEYEPAKTAEQRIADDLKRPIEEAIFPISQMVTGTGQKA